VVEVDWRSTAKVRPSNTRFLPSGVFNKH